MLWQKKTHYPEAVPKSSAEQVLCMNRDLFLPGLYGFMTQGHHLGIGHGDELDLWVDLIDATRR